MQNYSSSCFTNDSLILDVGAVGNVCSGRGQCINGLCVCQALWTGSSDVITLDGFACQNPIILDKLMWSFASIMHLKLFLQVLPVARLQLGRTKRSSSQRFSTLPAILTLEFLVLPGLIAVFATRAITGLNFGVDLGITLSYVIFFDLYMGLISYLDMILFEILTLGSNRMGQTSDTANMIRLDRRTVFCGSFFYLATYSATHIAGCFLSPGPTPERIANMVVLNTGAIVYFTWYYLHFRQLQHRLRGLIHSDRSSDKQTLLQNALTRVNESVKMSEKILLAVVTLYLLFMICLPIYSFQYMHLSFLHGIACGENHILLRFPSGREGINSTDLSPSKTREGTLDSSKFSDTPHRSAKLSAHLSSRNQKSPTEVTDGNLVIQSFINQSK